MRNLKNDRPFAQIATETQVAASGGSMQRCPQFSVTSIDVSTSIDQQADHVERIIDTALLLTQRQKVQKRVQQIDSTLHV